MKIDKFDVQVHDRWIDIIEMDKEIDRTEKEKKTLCLTNLFTCRYMIKRQINIYKNMQKKYRHEMKDGQIDIKIYDILELIRKINHEYIC